MLALKRDAPGLLEYLRCFAPLAALPALFASRAGEAEVVARALGAVAGAVGEGGCSDGSGAGAWALDLLQALAQTRGFATTAMMLDAGERALAQQAFDGLAGGGGGAEHQQRLASVRKAWGV